MLWLVTAPLAWAGSWLGWCAVVASLGLYVFFQVLCGTYYKYQNLRERYKAEWALVTGASTGASRRGSLAGPAERTARRITAHAAPHHTRAVTHAGIGRSLAKRLADQGLSVVLVALPDSHLDAAYDQLVADYPGVQFRKVCWGVGVCVCVCAEQAA
jgi:hypothetical protein